MTNWKTTLGNVLTVVSLIPGAIAALDIAVIPNWLVVTGVVCAFITHIWTGFKAKDGGVTGAGDSAKRVK